MGKKKLASISKISDKNSRNVTYCKRKRGLIKKAIELSKLCDQHVYLIIFDKEKQRMVEYNSSEDFNSKIICKLASPEFRKYLKYERYHNEHYPHFEKTNGVNDSQLFTKEPVNKKQDLDCYIDKVFSKNRQNIGNDDKEEVKSISIDDSLSDNGSASEFIKIKNRNKTQKEEKIKKRQKKEIDKTNVEQQEENPSITLREISDKSNDQMQIDNCQSAEMQIENKIPLQQEIPKQSEQIQISKQQQLKPQKQEQGQLASAEPTKKQEDQNAVKQYPIKQAQMNNIKYMVEQSNQITQNILVNNLNPVQRQWQQQQNQVGRQPVQQSQEAAVQQQQQVQNVSQTHQQLVPGGYDQFISSLQRNQTAFNPQLQKQNEIKQRALLTFMNPTKQFQNLNQSYQGTQLQNNIPQSQISEQIIQNQHIQQQSQTNAFKLYQATQNQHQSHMNLQKQLNSPLANAFSLRGTSQNSADGVRGQFDRQSLFNKNKFQQTNNSQLEQLSNKMRNQSPSNININQLNNVLQNQQNQKARLSPISKQESTRLSGGLNAGDNYIKKDFSIFDPNALESLKLNELFGQTQQYMNMMNENISQSERNINDNDNQLNPLVGDNTILTPLSHQLKKGNK